MDGPSDSKIGQVEPRMSAVVLVRDLEQRERHRHGGTRVQARTRLARRLGVAPGTLRSIVRDRLKRLDAELRDRIIGYAITDTQQEIARLEHHLQVARQIGLAQNSKLVSEAETLKAQFELVYSAITGVKA